MKRVLFIGDGEHDIGKPEWPTDAAFPARGVVPALARRVAAIDLSLIHISEPTRPY